MSERYEIKRRIGQGGVGAVYEAFDTLLNRSVAIKRLLSEEESEVAEGGLGTDLSKEAGILSSLHHPNIITLYDIAFDEEGAFVVMELIDGETIEDVVQRGAMTEEDFGVMVEQSLGALAAAQEKSLLHRDIKPTNIMVQWLPGGGFRIKVLDFGLAKYSAAPAVQTVDHGGAILGSIYFLAPEQFERIPLDGRTDLYAMGCVFYYCLTKKYPFDGESAPDVMMAHLEHRVDSLEEIRPDLAPELCAWVMRLMSREMDDRPEDAMAALREYRRIVAGESVEPPPILAPTLPPILASVPAPVAGGGGWEGEEGMPGGARTTSSRLIVGAAAPSREQLRRTLTSRSVATAAGDAVFAGSGRGGKLTSRAVLVAPGGGVVERKFPRVALLLSLVALMAIIVVAVAVVVKRDGAEEGAMVGGGGKEKGEGEGKKPVPLTGDGIPADGLAAHYLGSRGLMKGEGAEAQPGDAVWGWKDQAPYLGVNDMGIPEGAQGGGPIFEKPDKGKVGALKGATPAVVFAPGNALAVMAPEALGIPNNWEGGMTFSMVVRSSGEGNPRVLQFSGGAGSDEVPVAQLASGGETYSGGVRLGEGEAGFSSVKVNNGGLAIVTLVWDREEGSQRLFSRLPDGGRNSGPKVRREGGPESLGRWELGGAGETGGYAGEVFELAIYNRALSVEEVDVLEEALAKRYFEKP